MKVIIAIDSFKGSLSSKQLGETLEKGIKNIYPEAQVVKIPIADGGEGTVEAMVEGTVGKFIDIEVHDPLMRKIKSKYGILGNGKTAVIEMAAASGLPLVSENDRNPMKTTTYGTGEMVKDAIEKGCREFILGIGGSATNDGGLGMMQALGFRFFDCNGSLLNQGGEIMEKICKIDTSLSIPELKECNFLVACDVDNPFYGNRGAAHVFARQKGANDEMVEILDRGLMILSQKLKESFGKDVSNLPGAGAAGGLGGGLVAFLNATLKPGTEIILEEVGLEKHLEGADYVITGEGRIDFQTVMGKAPIGVSRLAKKYGVPAIGLAGAVSPGSEAVHREGLDAVFSIIQQPISLEKAMEEKNAEDFALRSIEQIFRLIKVLKG